jgi:Carboxypeptidase regulatory-like domain
MKLFQKTGVPLLCALACLTLAAGVTAAQERGTNEAQGGNLVGEVTNGGEPVAEAWVTLTGKTATLEATSDEQGRFRLAGLPTEIYTLTVEKPGYGSVTFTAVLVRSGRSTELEVTLKPEKG